MDTYYINLDAATDRREALEQNFRQFAAPTWKLTRVSAVDAREVKEKNLPGRLRPSEIGCMLSHRKAVATSLVDDDHAFIVEDDALFGPNTFSELEKLAILNDSAVDLVFTSALVPDLNSMNHLFLLRRNLMEKNQTCLLDLSKVVFAASDAYIVKKNSKIKLLSLMNAVSTFDVPYDLVLRTWIQQKMLTAALVFPCLTTLSPLADSTASINSHDTWHAWNCMRRLLAFDAAHYPGNPLSFLERIDPGYYDKETDDYTRVLRVLLAKKLIQG